MALYPDYCTLAELKAHLRIDDLDTTDDVPLAVAITAASRAVDHATNRQFGLGPEVAVPRIYDGNTYVMIEGRVAYPIFDLMTTTGLVIKVDEDDDATYERTLTLGTDLDLWPWNADADGRPWTHLVGRPSTAVAWVPCAARSLSVTAQWGWASVPDLVTNATLIQAARFFMRRDSPYGIAGSPETQSELRLLAQLDPDVRLMLSAVSRPWGAV